MVDVLTVRTRLGARCAGRGRRFNGSVSSTPSDGRETDDPTIFLATQQAHARPCSRYHAVGPAT